eukprot:352338-Chlamydomonas_euryale.AAC.9
MADTPDSRSLFIATYTSSGVSPAQQPWQTWQVRQQRVNAPPPSVPQSTDATLCVFKGQRFRWRRGSGGAAKLAYDEAQSTSPKRGWKRGSEPAPNNVAGSVRVNTMHLHSTEHACMPLLPDLSDYVDDIAAMAKYTHAMEFHATMWNMQEHTGMGWEGLREMQLTCAEVLEEGVLYHEVGRGVAQHPVRQRQERSRVPHERLD